MTRFGWFVLAGVVVVIVAIVSIGIIVRHHTSVASTPVPAATTTPSAIDPSALSIYTTGEYGFTFFYPSAAQIHDALSTSSPANFSWRTGATASGTPIVEVDTAGGTVRIGRSKDSQEVSACSTAGPAETSEPRTTISSTTWSVFTFDSVGTDNQEHVTSYRTVHDAYCYALETFVPFTSVSASSSPFSLAQIAQSFTFAN